MKYLVYILLFIVHCSWGQLKTYSFEEIDTLEVQKPMVVFLNADWCTYCKAMENTTFKNKKVIDALNQDFFFVSFNGESKDPIKFQHRTFSYKRTGKNTGVHELAEALGNYKGKLSYPTTVILNTKKEIIFQYPYFLRPKAFLKILDRIE